MGLKDLKSNLDLLGGFGNEGGTLGEMESFNPNKFQKPTTNASQAHIDSLSEVPGGSQNSPFQDLEGNPGPQFQLPTAQASQRHIDSLQEVPGGSQNSQFQDLNGEPGSQFQLPVAEASQKHIDSLTKQSTYNHGGSTENLDPSILDLNGNKGPQSQKPIDIADQVHKSSLSLVPGGSQNSDYQDINDGGKPQSFQRDTATADQFHKDSLRQGHTYQHGDSKVEVNASRLDLDGLPNNPSFGDVGGAGKQLGEQDLHVSMLTENYTYTSKLANPNTVTVNASVHDLNGGLPNNGEYLNNLPN